MRWLKHCVQLGDTREVARFAFLPVLVGGETWVWLERYGVRQEWVAERDKYGERRYRWREMERFLLEDVGSELPAKLEGAK
jgi:hypothetical protein